MSLKCYGLPSAFADAGKCSTCPHRVGCIESASALASALPSTPKVIEERKRLARFSVVRLAYTHSLKGQCLSVFNRMAKAGWFTYARGEILAGRNPGRQGWQRVVCSRLLSDGHVTRSTLRQDFIAHLGMTKGSAKVRVPNAVSILKAGNLLVEEGDGFILNPN